MATSAECHEDYDKISKEAPGFSGAIRRCRMCWCPWTVSSSKAED